MSLYGYQAQLLEDVEGAFAVGARGVLVQLATGGGKTHTIAEYITRRVHYGRRVVFLAHLDALLDDTFERLKAESIPCGIIQGDRAADPTAPVQVASLQTLERRGFGACPPADDCILDEAHRSAASSVRETLSFWKDARHLGLTATPQRGDGLPLDEYDRMVQGPTMRWLMAHGYLVSQCDVLAPGRYLEGRIAAEPSDAYLQCARGSRCLVFAPDLPTAREWRENFRRRGFVAEVLEGKTPRTTRRRFRDRMREGELEVLIGCTVFLEGWDLPEVETIVLARGFTTVMAYLQAIGRGLRASRTTMKPKCTVIDLRGAVNLWGLPDEDRRWTLDGTCVTRTERLPALGRCKECFAIFRPAPTCPRCGARAMAKDRVPIKLSRDEKLERFNDLPPEERDRRYFQSLLARAFKVVVPRLPPQIPPFRKKEIAHDWAQRQFFKARGRRYEAA